MPDDYGAWLNLPRAERNLARWLESRRGREIRDHALAAVMLAGLSATAVVGVTFVSWFLILGQGMGRTGGPRPEFNLDFPIVVLLILFAAVVLGFPVKYYFWRRTRTRISVRGGALTVDDGRVPTNLLVPSEDSTKQSNPVIDWVCFPATIFAYAAGHALAAWHILRCPPRVKAAVLTVLASHARRMPLSDLEMRLSGLDLPPALKALQHMPGVQWWTRDVVQVALSQDLQRELSARAEEG